MEEVVKMAEVELTITEDVKTTEELKVLLRKGWGAETTGKLAFKPAVDLKAGDGVKVTIEKVTYIPDPVEEKAEEAPETAEAAVADTEAVAEETSESVAEPVGEVVEKSEAAEETAEEVVADKVQASADDAKTA